MYVIKRDKKIIGTGATYQESIEKSALKIIADVPGKTEHEKKWRACSKIRRLLRSCDLYIEERI